MEENSISSLPDNRSIYQVIKDTRKGIEERKKGIMTPFSVLEKVTPSFADWLKCLSPVDPNSYFMIFGDNECCYSYRVYFWTETYEYVIKVVYPVKDNEKGYCGCQYSLRKPDVGEDWTRGGDLSDGIYDDKTFLAIEKDIVRNELKPIILF